MTNTAHFDETQDERAHNERAHDEPTYEGRADQQRLRVEHIDLAETSSENAEAGRALRVLRLGERGARPKAYLHAGLHADELPGMLVLRRLADMLEAHGGLRGEIILVPCANPIGLAQQESGYLWGRNEFGTGRNFNRDFPNLARAVKSNIGLELSDDAENNVAIIRKAMGEALGAMSPADPFEKLHISLLTLAHDADIVIDIHADNEALMHLYTRPAFWPDARDLAAELDARAVLIEEEAGGAPFDEACSRPWAELAEAFPDAPIPPACFSVTVELRSNNDVSADYAERDARALFRFLLRRGLIDGKSAELPRLTCDATPLTGMQQVKAPSPGIVVYKARLGDRLRTGDLIAQIVPLEGEPSDVLAETEGMLFARHNQPWAWEGKVIGKVAGRSPLPDRVGNLLSP